MESEDHTVQLCSRELAAKIANGELILRTTASKCRAWSVFAKIDDLNGRQIPGYVCCRTCRKVFRFSKSSSTSNLVKHICYVAKFIHKKQNSPAACKPEQLNAPISSSPKGNLDDNDNNLTKILTRCVIKNCRYYELLFDNDIKAVFQEFLAFGAKFGTGIDIGKFLPSPKAVARNIREIYGNCFNTVQAEIDVIKKNGFGLAVHVRENHFLKKNYMALTIYFLNQGTIRCRLLGLRPIEGEQCSNQDITEKVKHILEEYDCKLSSKSIIVTSGCSGGPTIQTLPCISELLDIALKKSMEEVPQVEELINSCLKLLNFLNRHELQIIPEQRLCTSRSIGLYEVLNSIAKHWLEIQSALLNKNEGAHARNIHIRHLRALVKTLEPFEEAFSSLEKENKATLHLVLVYLHELKKSCDSDDKDLEFIAALKEKLKLSLDKITIKNITIFHKLALFLYPPTKKLLQFDDEEKQHIEAECTNLIKSFETDLKLTVKQEPELALNSFSKRRKLFSDFVESETNNDQSEFIAQELQIYKISRVVYSEDFDVFQWWEQQKDNFPLLYKLSVMVFAIPATSSSAQRIFNSTGKLLSDKTSGLWPNETDIEYTAFIRFNTEQDGINYV